MSKLLPLYYCHKFLDIVFLYKAINNPILVGNDVLPVVGQVYRLTRPSKINSVTFIPKKCKSFTYQRSVFIRACCIWNALPDNLRNNITLTTFKKILMQYYNNALVVTYDQDDIRTWKTICPQLLMTGETL